MEFGAEGRLNRKKGFYACVEVGWLQTWCVYEVKLVIFIGKWIAWKVNIELEQI